MITTLSFDKVPFGAVELEVEEGLIKRLTLCEENQSHAPEAISPEGSHAEHQLRLYFSGRLKVFNLPIDFSEYSDFSALVLDALQSVPFGETISYGELAAMVGRPGAARAIGRVVGANRTPIIIPCHRVIGSTGKLVGFSATGGLEMKRWLLDFERKAVQTSVDLVTI